MAIRLRRAWRTQLNLLTVVERPDDVPLAQAHLHELRDLCRIGDGAATQVLTGEFRERISQGPQSDMDIMGLRAGPDLGFVAEMVRATRSSCLFTADSGWESVLA